MIFGFFMDIFPLVIVPILVSLRKQIWILCISYCNCSHHNTTNYWHTQGIQTNECEVYFKSINVYLFMASHCAIRTKENKDGLSDTTVWRTQKQSTIRNKNMGRDLFQVHSFPISYFRKKVHINVFPSSRLLNYNSESQTIG